MLLWVQLRVYRVASPRLCGKGRQDWRRCSMVLQYNLFVQTKVLVSIAIPCVCRRPGLQRSGGVQVSECVGVSWPTQRRRKGMLDYAAQQSVKQGGKSEAVKKRDRESILKSLFRWEDRGFWTTTVGGGGRGVCQSANDHSN